MRKELRVVSQPSPEEFHARALDAAATDGMGELHPVKIQDHRIQKSKFGDSVDSGAGVSARPTLLTERGTGRESFDSTPATRLYRKPAIRRVR